MYSEVRAQFGSDRGLNIVGVIQQNFLSENVVIDLVRFQSGYHAEMYFGGLVLFGLT